MQLLYLFIIFSIGTLPRAGILKQSSSATTNSCIVNEGSMQLRAVISPTRPTFPSNGGGVNTSTTSTYTQNTPMLHLGPNSVGNSVYLHGRPRDTIGQPTVCTMPNCSGKGLNYFVLSTKVPIIVNKQCNNWNNLIYYHYYRKGNNS